MTMFYFSFNSVLFHVVHLRKPLYRRQTDDRQYLPLGLLFHGKESCSEY